MAPVSVLVLGSLVVNAAWVWSAPTVNAPWGTIAGIDAVSPGGRQYSSYLAIPYALPPVGERRFEKPVAHPGLAEGQIHSANTTGFRCPQFVPPQLQGLVNEDCLTLNVHVPANSPGTKQVMVWVHGGGFVFGNAGDYIPSELVTENDVIVVVMQYRLGILGFLSSGDGVAVGNFGLWDQNLAFRWVKDNIRAFGGDPDTVTIFGKSAGSGSVGCHLLSPKSQGLYSRAILQSGVANAQITIERNPINGFNYVANKTRCLPSSSYLASMYYMVAGGRQQAEHERILSCLKGLDWRVMLPFTSIQSGESNFKMSPTIDGDFLPRDPAELTKDADYLESIGATAVDTMLGVNNEEGGFLYRTSPELARNRTLTDLDPSLGRGLIENGLVFSIPSIEKEPQRLKLLTDIAEFFYLKPLVNGRAKLKDTADLLADVLFVAPTVQFALALEKAKQKVSGRSPTGRTFMYLFNHYPAGRTGQVLNGMFHSDDLTFEFDSGNDVRRETFDADDFAVAARFRTMQSNFAKTGDPQLVVDQQLGSRWPEFTLEGQQYLSLGVTPRVEKRLYAKRMALWLDLLPSVFNSTQPQVHTHWPIANIMYGYGAQPVSFRGTMRIFKMNN